MKLRVLMSTCAVAVALGGPLRADAGTPAPLVLVLDASGSMWGQVKGEAKIVGARRVVGELAAGLEDARPIALVAYGHRREADCADIETVAPLAPLDRPALQRTVDRLNPKGKTPITAAVEHALGLAPPGATVVVVTDGLETCGGDPCATVRAARQRGAEFVLHVVGLDVGAEDVSSLECAAQAGGGLYLPAADSGELAAALETVVTLPPALPTSALVIEARRNGELQDVSVTIEPLSGGRALGARTYARPETNPRTIPLAAGGYRVKARALGIDGAPEQTFEIAIAEGDRVERMLDYSTGELTIGATRNGALSDVTWQVFAPGDRRRPVATGRTYRAPTSNPDRTTLPAGDYEVVLHALEIGGRPTADLGRVHVAADTPAALRHDFASGELVIGVVRGGTLVDATVVVRADRASFDAGRTYRSATSNPLRFTLAPGVYEVEVGEIGGGKRRLAVTVEAGRTVERTVDFDQPTP